MDDLFQKNLYGNLDYDSLWDLWLKIHSQPTPSGFYPLQPKEEVVGHWMKPEDMQSVLNAFSPYDLFMKPNPINMYEVDYPTSAFNIKGMGKLGIGDAILLASQDALSKLLPIYSVKKDAFKSPKEEYPYVPQGIYEHEVAHFKDPRLNSERMWSFPNKGYLTRVGLSGGLLQRENPAMIAESMFFDRVLDR